jgi:hypothetical protein
MTETTFKQFANLMVARRISVDDLCLEFRGQVESPRDLFERMREGCYADVVIPYHSVLKFFFREQKLRDMRKSGGRTRRIVKEFCHSLA